MSHAANLRKAHRSPPSSADLPAKRRKVDPLKSTRPQPNGTNGLLNGDISHNLSAVPVKDAKLPTRHSTTLATPVINYADEGGESSLDEASSESKDLSSREGGDLDASEDDESLRSGSSNRREPRNRKFSPKAAGLDTQVDNTEPLTSRPTEENQASKQAHAETSFGDLLRTRGEETLTVAADIPGETDAPKSPNPNASSSHQRASLPVPSVNSLGSVLTQALRTNDTPLLESCLQVSSLPSIRATIERLPSAHASNLLQKLAERMHKRPGRAGSLMVWIQWTIVAHGGYLAGQPAAMRSMQALYRVVKQRASGLQPLLALKGKLDMLEAQLQLRRNRMAAARQNEAGPGSGPGVVYVEGEESSSEASLKDEIEAGRGNHVVDHSPGKPSDDFLSEGLDSGHTMGAFPNGTITSEGEDGGDIESEEHGDSDTDEEDLIDDEAESTDNDSDDDMLEDDVDYTDVDEDEAEDEIGFPDSEDGGEARDEPVPKRRKSSSN